MNKAWAGSESAGCGSKAGSSPSSAHCPAAALLKSHWRSRNVATALMAACVPSIETREEGANGLVRRKRLVRFAYRYLYLEKHHRKPRNSDTLSCSAVVTSTIAFSKYLRGLLPTARLEPSLTARSAQGPERDRHPGWTSSAAEKNSQGELPRPAEAIIVLKRCSSKDASGILVEHLDESAVSTVPLRLLASIVIHCWSIRWRSRSRCAIPPNNQVADLEVRASMCLPKTYRYRLHPAGAGALPITK